MDATSTPATSYRIPAPSRMTALQPAVAGSTAASSQTTVAIAPTNAVPSTISDTAGRSRGPTIFASSTTVLQHGPTVNRGLSAKSSSGGTKPKQSGPASTHQILIGPSGQTTSP